MKGIRGDVIYERDAQRLPPSGEKGQKGFPGREADMGWMGYT